MTVYTITEEALSPCQAEHMSGGDTIVRDDILSGRLATIHVARCDGERLKAFSTRGAAERYVARCRRCEVAP